MGCGAVPGSATETPPQALSPSPKAHAGEGDLLQTRGDHSLGPLLYSLQTGATHGGHFRLPTPPHLRPVWVSGYGKRRALHLPHFIGGASLRWLRSLLFSARCTQCPRVTAIRVCTAIMRVGGRVVRAPGSGTAGRSARAGLVLLQSPAFRNAYIIQLLGGGMGIWLSYRIPAFPRSLVFGRKQGPWLFNYYCDGRAQVLSVGQVLGCFSFFRSLLQRSLLAGSGAQPPRLPFSQFPCNHLILVSPPPPLPPPS